MDDYESYDSDRSNMSYRPRSPNYEPSYFSDELSYFSDEPEPKRQRAPTRKVAVDRISALPDSVIVHILSFLPIEDAIKTELLSRKWQFLWTHLPSLLFCLRPEDPHGGEIRRFVSFVDETLVLCNCSKLEKFGVDLAYEWGFASSVNRWTRFAAGRGTAEFHLELRNTEDVSEVSDINHSYVLPQHLYVNSSFRELHFSSCRVMPGGVVDWNHLKKLSLGYVELSEDVIQKILAGSPVLEFLELYCFYGVNRLSFGNSSVKKLILREIWEPELGYNSDLEISAPNLHSLDILGCLGRTNIRLVDISSLVDATLNFNVDEDDDSDDDYETFQNILRQLLESLARVKNITLGIWVIQVLSIMKVEGLPSPLFRKCECLTLEAGIGKSVLPGIASLLESSPHLQTLVMTMSSLPRVKHFEHRVSELCEFDEKDYWTSQKRTFKCLMLHLTKVRFAGLRRHHHGTGFFPFVQFLLKNAWVLQTMVINALWADINLMTEFFPKLLSFPRSSPNAVVIFSE